MSKESRGKTGNHMPQGQAGLDTAPLWGMEWANGPKLGTLGGRDAVLRGPLSPGVSTDGQ